MEKRRIIFGTYDTAANGLWTLTSWKLSAATRKSNWVEVPGRDGDIDVSTAIIDGVPRYQNRTLTAVLESSEGTRLERKARIDTMVNWLDGWTMNIVLPDDPTHYVTGVIHVEELYNDPAHASVEVTAECQPWRFSAEETKVILQATEEQQTAALLNQGRRTVVPLLEVTGGDVLLSFGASSWALGVGTYALPDLVVTQGEASITYSGTGVLTFTYREAVL